MWPDRRVLDLLGIEWPIIQAPMAGSNDAGLVVAVSEAGGLGSLPCAMLSTEQIKAQLDLIRQQTSRPVNLNFFCHTPPSADAAREAQWKAALAPEFARLGLDPAASAPAAQRAPFNADHCALVEQYRPAVVSFHFGLPESGLLARVKAAGAKVLSSATTTAEARWLEAHGADIIIAQGAEAGGHRGNFLVDDVLADAAQQPGLFALLPQVVDAVRVPVIAAGGISDGRGVAAAFVLGAAAAQIGTAYLLTPEAKTSAVHRAALQSAKDGDTALTNLFSGRPARGIVNHIMRALGPITRQAPAFPLAGNALAPLRAASEAKSNGSYSPLWSGQAVALARPMPAAELTRKLATDALRQLGRSS